jgi:hypothetical protein
LFSGFLYHIALHYIMYIRAFWASWLYLLDWKYALFGCFVYTYGAYGLGSFWSFDSCYELSCFKTVNMVNNYWNLKFVHHWDWKLACVGYVEISIAIIYMLGCYVSCFESFTCLDNLKILVLKFKKQAKWWEKIEMGLYYPTSRYRDSFQLHIWMNLSLIVDAKTIVLRSDCLWHRLGMVAKLGLMVQITSRTHKFWQILVLSCELR